MPTDRGPDARARAEAGDRDIAPQRSERDSLAHPPPQVTDLIRRRRIERVHRLGPRVMAELLDEIARHHGIGADIDRRLAGYAALDPRILAAVGGDRFPALPVHIVAGSDDG